MKFWEFKNAGADVDELHITGDIVDDDRVWLYEWFGDPCTSPNAFREELNKCKAKNLNVWIDSYGGSVFAAAGIYNALKAFKGHVTTIVDGKAMSAGSVIAMAGETVKMSPVGILMIHNPLTSVSGYASELRKAADVLDVVKNTIINAYVLKTGKSRDELSAMMDDEKYMSAGEAMKLGFVDEILEADKKQSGVLNCAFNFDFSRSAILNYGAEDMRKVMERIKQQPPDEPKNEEPETPPVNGGISLPETPDNGEGTQPVADMTALDAQKRRFALNNRKRILTEE